MRVVVTGCHGLLGTAVCAALAERGDKVAGLDAAPAARSARPVVIDTLLDPYAVHRAIDLVGGEADAIIHLANHTNSKASTPDTVLRENLAMNTNVFMAALGRGVRRVVFSSSVQAMMGGFETDGSWNERLPTGFPINEETPCKPTNVYGLSKLLSERMLDELTCAGRFARGSGTTNRLSAVSVRLPFVVDGGSFARLLEQTRASEYRWGGSEAFAYIGVEDAAEALALAAGADIDGHEVIWCAAPDPRTNATIEALVETYFVEVDGAARAIERSSFVDCGKASRLLGWEARRVLREARSAKDRSRPPA